MIKTNWIVLCIVLFFAKSIAQTASATIPVQFKLKFNTSKVTKGQDFISSKGDTLSIETFKCYISNVKLEYTDKTYSEEQNSFHLLDLDSLNTFKFNLPKQENKQISNITFNIGIDSINNTSGIQTGVLDPMNGMYWAWQSGYINFKIEGKSSSCKTRQNKYQFHVGGYLAPYYAMRKAEITIENENNITIDIDLAKFFNEIDLAKINEVMIPGKKAMELSDLSVQLFKRE